MATGVQPPVTGAQPFLSRPVTSGVMVETTHGGRKFRICGWRDDGLALADSATHYGVVLDGTASLEGASGRFQLRSGMYFAQLNSASIGAAGRGRGRGRGLVISQDAYQGLFHVGGPIESTGRLRYIDGCSDTLLISPALRGDACLNLLHLPAGTHQTSHTHPSFRTGLVIAGHGTCRTDDGQYALEPGSVFFIEADVVHCFHTAAEPLLIVAFHPDSDFGPVDHDHPMVNRTLIDGISASRLSDAGRRQAGGNS